MPLGVVAFLVSIAYVPWWSGAAITPRWAIMAVGAAVLICGTKTAPPRSITRADALGVAFVAYCALSVAWSPVFVEAADELMKLGILALLFVVGRSVSSLLSAYIGFGAGMTVNSVIMIVERVAYGVETQGIGINPEFGGVALPHVGLFFNPNFAAESAAVVVVALAMSRLWWLVLGVWPTLVLAGSRGAILGLLAAACGYLAPRSRLGAFALATAGIVGVVLAFMLANRSTAGISDRLHIWTDTLSGLTLFGHGIGSYWVTFPQFATFDVNLSRPDHAHNDALELSYELGIGAVCAAWLVIELLRYANETERLAIIAFLAIGLAGFPLHLPATAFLFAVMAGHAARGSVPVRLPFMLRRTGIFGPVQQQADRLSHDPAPLR